MKSSFLIFTEISLIGGVQSLICRSFVIAYSASSSFLDFHKNRAKK